MYAGEPADIFSLGVLLYVMLACGYPHNIACDQYHRMFMKNPERYLKW